VALTLVALSLSQPASRAVIVQMVVAGDRRSCRPATELRRDREIGRANGDRNKTGSRSMRWRSFVA